MNNTPIDIIYEISNYLNNKSFIDLISTNKSFYYHNYLIKERKQREKDDNEFQNQFITVLEFLRGPVTPLRPLY
jgi:hypothetical protein